MTPARPRPLQIIVISSAERESNDSRREHPAAVALSEASIRA
jgi:hypothetical protein